MVEAEPKTTDRSKDAPAKAAKRRRWQWNLKTLLLLMAVIATWTAYVRTTHLNQRLRGEVDDLRELAGELVVTDPNQFAIVNTPEQWFGDNRWEVYLPPGAQYVLKLGERELDSAGLPGVTQSVRLSPGRRQVQLEQVQRDDHSEVNVEVDGRVVITAREPRDAPKYRALGAYTRSQQFPTSKPLILVSSRLFGRAARPLPPPARRGSTEPQGPSNGMTLWIEKAQR